MNIRANHIYKLFSFLCLFLFIHCNSNTEREEMIYSEIIKSDTIIFYHFYGESLTGNTHLIIRNKETKFRFILSEEHFQRFEIEKYTKDSIIFTAYIDSLMKGRSKTYALDLKKNHNTFMGDDGKFYPISGD